MSDSKLAKLFFTVELIDRISKPAGKAGASVQKMYNNMRLGMDGLSKGALSMGAGFAALSQFTAPARDLSKAIGEVSSLGTSTAELDKLKSAAMDFSSQFGVSASDVVRSAYDIQSAIPGLAEGALAAFTTSAGLLAKATKSDVGVITSYYGTMYNVFSETAEQMGQDKWVKRLAGRTAEAVRIFKTTGPQMADAFSRIGSAAQVKGIGESEQTATLGMLQATMTGGEAGTKYKAFLTSIGRAGGALGGITNKDGSLMSVPAILDKINAKTAKFNKVKKGTYLKNLLGSDEAVAFVENLSGKTGDFRKNIEQIEKVQGDSNAQKMAESMVDPYEQMTKALENMRIAIGETVLPAVNLLMTAISGVANSIRWIIDYVPGVSVIVGGLTFAALSLSMALGVLYAYSGLKMMFDAIAIKLRIVQACMWKYSKAAHAGTFTHKYATVWMYVYNTALGKTALAQKVCYIAQMMWLAVSQKGLFLMKVGLIWQSLQNVISLKGISLTLGRAAATETLTWAQRKALFMEKGRVLWMGILNGAMIAGKVIMMVGMIPAMIAYIATMGVLKGVLLLAQGAVWLFNVALYANPIGLIVLGIVALIGVVIAAVYWWDEWTGALMTFGKWCWDGVISAFQALCGWFDSAKSSLGAFGGILYALPIIGQIMQIRDLCSWISELWNESESFTDFLKNVFFGTVEAIWSPFSTFFAWLWEKFNAIPEMVGKLSFLWDWIPGLGQTAAPDVAGISASEPAVQQAVEFRRNPAPGIPARNTNATTNNSTNYGGVTIKTNTFPTPGQLEEWSLLNG